MNTLTKYNFYSFNKACKASEHHNIDTISEYLHKYYPITKDENNSYLDIKTDKMIFTRYRTFDFKGYTITTVYRNGIAYKLEIDRK